MKIISNRIRLLAQQETPFVNQDNKLKKYDPIRSGVKMLPVGNL